MPYSALKFLHHPRRLAELKAGHQPAPAQVQLIISDFCNHDCPWCSYRLEGYSSNALFNIVRPDGTVNHNPNRMIPTAKVLEILADCAELGVCAIQVTGGGEPTVHPQHVEILTAVLERGLDLALVTNGTVMRDGVVPVLLRARWVRMSMDAGTAQTYAATRRVSPALFGRFLANLRRLCASRDAAGAEVTVGVGFVVNKDNWREVLTATRIARESGADNIRLSAVFQPEDERYFDGFYDAARDLCREAEQLAGGRFRVYNNFGDRLGDLRQGAPDYSFCGYQHFSTYIGADLNVYRCCVQSYNPRGLIGSIADRRFRDLWESQAKREAYANFDARGCDRCMFNNKNRAINYVLRDDPPHVNFV